MPAALAAALEGHGVLAGLAAGAFVSDPSWPSVWDGTPAKSVTFHRRPMPRSAVRGGQIA